MRENEIRTQAEQFNRQYFEGQLPLDCIEFKVSKKMVKTRGTYQSRSLYQKSGVIKLSQILLESEFEWQRTLLHEMIHAYQHFNLNVRPDHGYTFKTISRHIRYLSNGEYNINRVTNVEDEKVAERIQQVYQQKSKHHTHYVAYKTVHGKKQYNFVKNLNSQDIQFLKNKGYTIGVTDNDFHQIRCCKNASYVNRAKYYYSEKIVKKVGVNWRTI